MIFFHVLMVFFPIASSSQKISMKIVGGNKDIIKNRPYQLSVHENGRFICGASILSPKFAITAAHCVIPGIFPTFRAGSTSRSHGGQIVKARRIFKHPKYNSRNVDFDIAIIEIIPNFQFNENISNVNFLGGREPVEGQIGVASGWGSLEEDGTHIPINLRVVEIPVISRVNCSRAYFKKGILITERMICAGDLKNGGKDSCQGDSGGPLTINDQLVGIISFGLGCGRSKYPGIYTNINNKIIKKFIKRITGL